MDFKIGPYFSIEVSGKISLSGKFTEQSGVKWVLGKPLEHYGKRI